MKLPFSRRQFIGLSGNLLLLLLGYAGYRATRDAGRGRKPGSFVYQGRVPEGLTMSGPVIIHKQNDRIRVFSSACTHLGCRIGITEDSRLVCPCHGSEYHPDGNIIKGPAKRPLPELVHTFMENGDLLITLPD